MLVLDASVTLAWHFEDEQPERAEAAARRAFEVGALVPQHWLLEVASGLLKGERRRRTNAAATHAFLERLWDIRLEVEAIDLGRIGSVLLPVARAHRLSLYDAAYLELALRRGVALATLDEAMIVAARSMGVEVIGAGKDMI